MKKQLLIIDDDPKAGRLMERFLSGDNYQCHVYQDPLAGVEHFISQGADLVITDMQMPNMNGAEVMQQIRQKDSTTPVIIITAYSNVDNAIEALRLGATDFIKKPFDMTELKLVIDKTLDVSDLRKENIRLKQQLSDEERYRIIGTSVAIQKVYDVINRIADIRCNVIIEGESGTGKELAARAIHTQSKFRDNPFIVIDCGSLTDSLLQSELFGHEKGAFTGATKQKRGLLEEASGGTLFLDEICNISDNMQTKLLRVVQEQQITRVGGVQPIDIDVRFVVASNRPLQKMVADGLFRHDLYHRLNVISIEMPPLRERVDDIPMLAETLIQRFASKYNRDIKGFDKASLDLMSHYGWPGNVRELSNLIERSIALSDSEYMHLDQLGDAQIKSSATNVSPTVGADGSGIDGDQPTLAELEKRYILKMLEQFEGNREQTAQTLGINKSTLWRKLKEYQAS